MAATIINVNFQRRQARTFTCHLYTSTREKYRLVINASNTTDAYHNAIVESVRRGVFNIRCIAFFSQKPEHIINTTEPLKVHLVTGIERQVNS